MITTTQNYMTKTSDINIGVAIVSLTEKSIISAYKISEIFENSTVFVMSKHKKLSKKDAILYDDFSLMVKDVFYNYKAIIFVMATGIVVRSIAKYVEDKTIDPAIIVCDEKLNFAISLLSGHIGGANKICNYMSENMNITPVITTATDINKKAALDNIVIILGAFCNEDRDIYKNINYKLANDEKVYLITDIDLPYNINLSGFSLINEDEINSVDDEYIIHITYKEDTKIKAKNYKKIIPRVISLGIGCKKNTPYDAIYENVSNYLKKHNISKKAIKQIGSIDIKKDEDGLIKLSEKFGVEFITFSADEIKSSKYYEEIEKNAFVSSITGVNSVSLAVAKIMSDNNVLCDNFKGNSLTIACGIKL